MVSTGYDFVENNVYDKNHGDIILRRMNYRQISIETSTPQHAGGFIIKRYPGISTIAAFRQNGQIFRLFKGTYFMDGPRDNDKSHEQKSKNYFRSMI